MSELLSASPDAFIFENSSDGILIFGNNGTIEKVNPSSTVLLDEAAEALIGREADRIFADNTALKRLLETPNNEAENVPLVNGRFVSVKTAKLENGSGIILLHETIDSRDMTAQRERFVRAAVHDLRNPIAALIGYSSLLEGVEVLGEEERLFIRRLQETSTKLHHAAAKLIESAWIEAKMPIRRLPCDFGAVVANAVEAITPLAQERNQTIAYEHPAQPETVLGDEERLGAAVYELLHNAITYSSEGDDTVVRVWHEENTVYASVVDSGVGILESELESVFDRLYRSRDERVKAIPGGGVGLTLARKIVQYHGGDITAVSRLNEGSTFTIRLPLMG